MRQLYFDFNTTTPMAPSVQEAMLPYLAQHFGDPIGSHPLSRAAAEAVADARNQVASLLGADNDEIIFTSGGTESNNLALKGLMLNAGTIGNGHLIISAIEHASVSKSAAFLERLGFDVTVVGVTGQGVVQPSSIKAAIRPDTLLVSVIHANHEIGTIQPLKQIAEICHQRQVLLHTDASQTVGKIRTFVDELDVDLLSLSGHKFYAPKGIGALYIRRGALLEPLFHGDGQESGLRSGIENVPSIVALGKACSLAQKCLDESQERLLMLRDRLWNQLQRGIGDNLTLHGTLATRLPNTLCLAFPKVEAQSLLELIPELCVSTGAAPYTNTTTISPTLAAMGIGGDQARSTIRLSIGWYTSEEEIDRVSNLLIDAWERLTN